MGDAGQRNAPVGRKPGRANPDVQNGDPEVIAADASPCPVLPRYLGVRPRRARARRAMTKSPMKMKNRICAIPADALAMPPKPNSAATSAIMRKAIAHPSMVSTPLRLHWRNDPCPGLFQTREGDDAINRCGVRSGRRLGARAAHPRSERVRTAGTRSEADPRA